MAQYQWLLLALVGPFLYATTNHIDKHLLERYFKKGGVAVLILYSSLLSLLALPVIYLADPNVLAVDGESVLVLTVVAFLDVALLWAYLNALHGDEPTVVIIFYQFVPVLGLIFGYFILGEVITDMQLGAMIIIIGGATIISFENDGVNGFAFKKKTVGYMLVASTCWALETTIFKKVALEENVWRSLFWEHLVLGGVGVGIFSFVPKYRRRFLREFKSNSTAILSLNVLNEGLYMTGNMVTAFAVMMAPVALTLLMNAYQPIFVMMIGIVIAACFPKFATERVEKRHMVKKLVAIAITGSGTYLLLSA